METILGEYIIGIHSPIPKNQTDFVAVDLLLKP